MSAPANYQKERAADERENKRMNRGEDEGGRIIHPSSAACTQADIPHPFFRRRRGASILEMSVVLSVLVVTTFGMLDVGSGVFRYNVLNHAARQGARRAIVHGTLSSVEGTWGPTTIGPIAATTTGVPIVDGSGPNPNDGIAKTLVGCDLAHTTIQVQWIDGGNGLGQRVRVTLTSPYKPFMTFLTPVTITAASTMQITH